jgi:hypothetical protein
VNELVIHTKGQGHLGIAPQEVARIASVVSAAQRVVIHIHGGLVKKSSGLAGAQRLDPFYRAAGVLPMFPVWESGLFETLGNNWKELFDERLFKVLLKRILIHVGGKLRQTSGARALQTYDPLTNLEAQQALVDADGSTGAAKNWISVNVGSANLSTSWC